MKLNIGEASTTGNAILSGIWADAELRLSCHLQVDGSDAAARAVWEVAAVVTILDVPLVKPPSCSGWTSSNPTCASQSHIAMDFVTGVPLSEVSTTILKIIDRFSKAVHFVPLCKFP